MDELIEHMKFCGWTQEEDGTVTNPECETYPNWIEAIKSCIEVASGA